MAQTKCNKRLLIPMAVLGLIMAVYDPKHRKCGHNRLLFPMAIWHTAKWVIIGCFMANMANSEHSW